MNENNVNVRAVQNRRLLASMSVQVGSGETLTVDVLEQDDGGVWVVQKAVQVGGGTKVTTTCFYCAGKLIGCVKCKNPEGNCITRKVGCY